MPECPFDVAAIARLAERARALIHEHGDVLASSGPREMLQLRSAELALVAAARMAAQVGAVGLVRELHRWAHASPVAEDPISVVYELTEALSVSVREGLEPEQLRGLLDELGDWQIARVAAALDPERAGDLELLHRLAEDPRAEVATAASRRLGPRREWSWHARIFAEDPIAAHADEPAVVEALTRARAALGRVRPGAKPGEARALLAALEGLPPALALPLLEAGLAVFPFVGFRAAAPESAPGEGLGDRLHALGGVDALFDALGRVLEAHGDAKHALLRVAPWYASLPEPARVELSLRLLAWVEPPPADEALARTPRARAHAARSRGAARLLAKLWPRTRSPLPLVEWLTGSGRRDPLASQILMGAIEKTRAELEPDVERLLALILEHPHLAIMLPRLVEKLTHALPLPQLAAQVETAAGSGNNELRSWALEQRSGRLAPAEADERDALAAAWLDDPETRKIIMSSKVIRARLLPWLRRRLQAGALTLTEATTTMITIGELYGGVAEPAGLGGLQRPDNELEAAERRAQARAGLGAWTAPPSGPPTSTEWASLRALARQLVEDAEGPPWRVLAVRPVGPWTLEDLALLDALEARALSGERTALVVLNHLEQLMDGARVPDAAARARRLLDAWAPHAERHGRPDLGWLRRLAEGPAAAAASASASATVPDWMDEEDEELEP